MNNFFRRSQLFIRQEIQQTIIITFSSLNSQVHLYTNCSFDGIDNINFPMNQITRMDIYGVDIIYIRNHKTRFILLITAGTIVYAGFLVLYVSKGGEL